jgi:hypothetical protein
MINFDKASRWEIVENLRIKLELEGPFCDSLCISFLILSKQESWVS